MALRQPGGSQRPGPEDHHSPNRVPGDQNSSERITQDSADPDVYLSRGRHSSVDDNNALPDNRPLLLQNNSAPHPVTVGPHVIDKQNHFPLDRAPAATGCSWRPLPAWARFYLYGLQGVFDEVVFTALFDLVFHRDGNPFLQGCTSMLSFVMYGSCTFAAEQLVYLPCIKRGYLSIWRRLPLYVLAIYTWELGWGLALTQIGACSWDYSHYPLNLWGLITLVYLPGWLILSLLQDVVFRFIFGLHVMTPDLEAKVKVK